MPANLPTKTQGEVTEKRTRGFYLMQIDFASPLRLSTRGTETYDGDVYTTASLRIEITANGLSGSMKLFNENFQFTEFILEQAAGKVVTVRELYGERPFVVADARVVFSGVLGAGVVQNRISFALVQPEMRWSPRQKITNADFKHIPRPGTVFATPDGLIELGIK